jgi:hypothetical protein
MLDHQRNDFIVRKFTTAQSSSLYIASLVRKSSRGLIFILAIKSISFFFVSG